MFRWIWPGVGLAVVVVGAILYWGLDSSAGLVMMIAGGIWATIAVIPAGIRGSAYSSDLVDEDDIPGAEDDRR